jgi:hypothetical protein
LALGLFAFLVFLWSDSPQWNRDSQLDFADLAAAEHFVVTQKTTFSALRSPPETFGMTVYFQSPDIWRLLLSDIESPSGQVIVKGDQAWIDAGGQWLPRDAKRYHDTELSFVEALSAFRQGPPATNQGKGPEVDGETTSRFRFDLSKGISQATSSFDRVSPAYGIRDAEREQNRKLWQDTKATLDLLVGDDSRRIYAAEMRVKGTNITMKQIFSFDYATPVHIETPVGFK